MGIPLCSLLTVLVKPGSRRRCVPPEMVSGDPQPFRGNQVIATSVIPRYTTAGCSLFANK